MRAIPPLFFRSSASILLAQSASKSQSPPPLIEIKNATFYRQHPSSAPDAAVNPPLFSGLSFTLPTTSTPNLICAIIGPSSCGKTTFLDILRGQHLCFPPNARLFPYLATEEIARKDHRLRVPSRAIQYVGFGDGGGGLRSSAIKGAYLSARYESRKEDTDFSLLGYLTGQTELNPSEKPTSKSGDTALLEKVIEDLDLGNLVGLPVGNLSNGQTRRARIARALLQTPEVLLLDEPFMGLDPPTVAKLSALLKRLAIARTPHLVMTLRSQDPIPTWVTHLIHLGPGMKVLDQGPRASVTASATPESKIRERAGSRHGRTAQYVKAPYVSKKTPRPMLPLDFRDGLRFEGGTADLTKMNAKALYAFKEADRRFRRGQKGPALLEGLSLSHMTPDGLVLKGDVSPPAPAEAKSGGEREALVEMAGVNVAYGDRQVLGNWESRIEGQNRPGLWWNVRRGERWGVFGPNGSGKTTLLSLICSDHPQTYSLPIQLFGRSRLPQPGVPGISIFDIQSRIGHSSPEVHNFFPRNATVRQVLENAWADTFLGKALLNHERDCKVDACLRWFEADLNPSRNPTPPSAAQAAVSEPGDSKVATYVEPGVDTEELGELEWADELRFREIPFSAQRVALFLRAIIKQPDLVILDEAFSGMDEHLRDKCMLYLEYGESREFAWPYGREHDDWRVVAASTIAKKLQVQFDGLRPDQALICVSHVKEEVPRLVRQWICLPEANEGHPARVGTLEGPMRKNGWQGWKDIWGEEAQ